MDHAFARTPSNAQSEYSVYIYHLPENQHEGQNDWEMRKITHDIKVAMKEALALHHSRSFRMVEVKQRVHDPKTQQVSDHTLKIFDHEKSPLLEKASLFYASISAVLFTALITFIILNIF